MVPHEIGWMVNSISFTTQHEGHTVSEQARQKTRFLEKCGTRTTGKTGIDGTE